MIGPHAPSDPEKSETLVLTATERLARELREAHNLQRADRGDRVWEAPRVQSWSRWLIDTWTASWPDAQLLSATQELVLWRSAIERDGTHTLLAPLSAAREARRADQLLRRHRIDLDAWPAWQDEHQAFRRWRAQVTRQLTEHHWLTSADIPREVCALLETGAVGTLPVRIELAGFIEPPGAAEQAVLNALRARGVDLQTRAPPVPEVQVHRHRLPDEAAQWRWVAQQLQLALQPFVQSGKRPPRLLLALPDPDAAREPLEAALRDALLPASGLADDAPALLPWRWARGRPLAEQPLVDSLLAALQLQAERNAPALVSRVLLSGALWSEAQRAETAAVDARLRDAGRPQIPLQRLTQLGPQDLRERFARLLALLQAAPSRALPSAWSQHFLQRLTALGWPGVEALDSQSYQAVRAARGLLDRLGTLDAQLGRVPETTAREWLGELLRATDFEPRADHEQPIFITRLDEAATLQADLLFVLDATSQRLPPQRRASPFVAQDALRTAGAAEADPSAWLARTQAQVQALLQQVAPQVHVCAPRLDARGAELLVSTLFGDAQAWPDASTPDAVGALEAALPQDPAARPLQRPDADSVPPVDPEEQAGLRADAALFKAWFESPFFAFARYRLGVESLPESAAGMDARVQGNLVHAVLEALWAQIGDSRNLEALRHAGTLDALIDTTLDAQLPQLLAEADYGAAMVRLERQRVRALLQQWLAHETRRLDPFHVRAIEPNAQPTVAGLSLRLRLDRVDEVQTPYGARWLVIDYKTGRNAEPRGWKAERLEEPQLPLYAGYAATLAAGVPQVDGICFGHLKDGHPALAAQTSWRKKLINDPAADTDGEWQARLGQWRVALEAAAQGFLAGEAGLAQRVKPRSHYADLLPLAAQGEDDDADGDEGDA